MLAENQSRDSSYELYTDWKDLDNWGVLEEKENEPPEQTQNSNDNVKSYQENKSIRKTQNSRW